MAALVSAAFAFVISSYLIDSIRSGRLRADFRARPFHTIWGIFLLLVMAAVFWLVTLLSAIFVINEDAAVALWLAIIHSL